MQKDDVEKLFNSYKPFISYLSRLYSRKYSFIEYEDLFAYLSLQFVESCNKYDPTKIATFEDFIKFILQKRSLDYLRKQIQRKKAETLVEDVSLLGSDVFDNSFEEMIVDKVIVEELIDTLRTESPKDAEFLTEIIFLDKSFSDKELLKKYNLKGPDYCYYRYTLLLKRLRELLDESKG